MTHYSAVKTDLLKMLNLLDNYLQNDEEQARQDLLEQSDPASLETLVFAEEARDRLTTAQEQRLEVALLKRQAERAAESNAPSSEDFAPQPFVGTNDDGESVLYF